MKLLVRFHFMKSLWALKDRGKDEKMKNRERSGNVALLPNILFWPIY